MTVIRPVRTLLASTLVGAAIVACTASSVGATTISAVPSTLSASASSPHSSGKPPAVTLPADWPTTVPLPAGTLTAASGQSPRWSLLLVVNGSAAQVQHDAIAFYLARGWKKEGSNGVKKNHLHMGLGATNRDHSNTSSNLTIVLAKY